MPTAAEVEDFQAAADDVNAIMVASLVSYWASEVDGNPAPSLNDLRDFIYDAIAEYGQSTAAVAIDFYESVRPAGSPAFIPVPQVRDDLLEVGTLKWSIGPLFDADYETSLTRIAAEIQKATMQAAIETIGEATADDQLDVKFARWPTNPDPCAYCVLRASRGAVYWTEATATRGDHVKCGCKATPIFPGEPLPYLRKPYIAAFQAGEAEASEPGLKPLLAAMRKANGTR